MSTWIRRGVVALTALGTVVGSLALSAPSAGAVAPSPKTPNPGDCSHPIPVPTPDPTNCIASFTPSHAKAGATVSVTIDVTGSGGVYTSFPFTTIAFTQGNSTVEIGFKTVAGDNRSGTFVMPVLPAGGTWNVDIVTTGAHQGFGQMTYDGAGDWVCESGWDQAIADSRTFCEKRFTSDGSLTVPTGITSLDFLVVGGGGGGGGGLIDTNAQSYGAGGGGGGGQVTTCTKTVVPQDVWTVTVGTGGAAGATRSSDSVNGINGSNGTASSVKLSTDNTNKCEAAGGQGGGVTGGNSTGPARAVHTAVRPRGGTQPTPAAEGAGGKSGSGSLGGDPFSGYTFAAGGGGGGAANQADGGYGSDATSAAKAGDGGAGWSPSGIWSDLSGMGGGGGGGSVGDGNPYTGTGGTGYDGGGQGASCEDQGGTPDCQGAAFADNLPRANSGGGGGGGAADAGAGAGAAGLVIARYEVGGGGGGSTPDCINSLTPADIYTTTQDCVVPAGVTKISIVIVGGGGGGGKGSANAGGGGGGGGAGNLCADIQVTPGETLSLTVGAGGSGDSGSGASDGGTSTAVSASSVNPLCEAPGGKKGVLDGGAAGTGSLGGTASPAAGGGGGGSSFPGDAANGTSAGNGGAGFFVIPVGGGGGGGSVGGQPGQGQAGGGNGSADATCAADAAGTANSGGGGGGGTPDCNGGAGGGGFVALQFAPTPSCIDGDFGYTFDFYSQTGGSYSCAVPAGKQTVDILVVGGGGGGGYGDTDSGSAGGGGGGGEVKVCSGIPVTPGDTLDLSVGSPGGGGAKDVAGTTPASAGGVSTVMSGASKLCEALGGAAGQSAGEGFPGAGGGSGSTQAGGAAVLNGQIVTAGGGGGGASSAGSAGSGLCGGAGGAGQSVSQLATPGLFSTVSYVFGGGGGGGSTVPNNTAPVQHPPCDSQLGGLGGTGGGGDGAPTAIWPGQLAADSTGGGGGGGSPTYCAPGGSPCGNGGGAAAGYVELRFSPAYVLKECALTSDNADGDQAVSLIDIATDSLDGGPTALDSSPYPAVLSPSGTRAYVAVSGYVKILDTVSRTVLSQILIDNNVVSLAISPDGSTLYVSTGFGIVVVDVRTKVATPLDAPLMASQQIVLSPDGTKLYTYDSISGKVVTINTSDETVVARPSASTLTSGGQTYSSAMAISRDGTKLYLGFDDNATGQIAVVDTTDSSLVKYVSLGASPAPSGLAVGADGTVYATNTNDSLVLAVDPSSQGSNVLRTISVSIAPQAIAASPTGTKLFVGHGGYQAVTPIDISTPSAPVAGIDLSTVANDITAGYCVDANNAPTGTGRVWIERDLGSGGVPVDTNGALDLTVSCENPTYTSITAAVAAAQANDIIHVCSGTYREDEIVPTVDNLTIQGTEWVDPSTAPSPGPGRPASRHVGATLTDPVIIDGEATEGDSSTRHRIFDATDLNITFKDVVLQNGSSDTYGGAVKAYQAVFVDSTVQDNRAPGGGAVFVSGQPTCDSPITRFLPGIQTCAPTAIFGPVSEPSVTVTNSEFLRNGVAELTDAPIRRGAAYSGGSIDGGAIYANAGAVSVTDSTFEANEALKTNDVPLTSDGAGGAIIADSVEVYGSTFTSNKALYHGGAIASSSVKVRASTTAGAPVATVFDSNDVAGDATWDGYGGAIWAAGVDVANASFVSNTADSGGAIASAVQQDQAPVVPSTVLTPATVTIEASTFEDNSATADGGAVLNKAVDGSTTVYNSTFSANDARNAGGAIYAQDALTVSFSTFDANTAGVSGGVFWTPVAPSVDDNIFSFAAADENEATRNGCLTYEWTPAKDVKNFTTNYWCPGTVVTSAELALSPLADNGGPTKTIALGATSVALDVADQTECDSRTNPTDERGNHRPVGKACDAGAYEYFGQVTLDTPPGTPGSFTSESGVKTLHILLVGGGGGGGAYGPNGEAGGGGGGGEVVECTINLTVNQTEVHYYFGLGGAEGEDGEDSKIWTTDEANPECFAAGGKAGVQGGDGTGAGAGGNAGGDAGLGGDAALCAAPATCTEGQTLAGGGGGGAGGNGADGSFDSSTLSAVGGSGGPGVSPSSVAFGDNAQLYGGGGGGGAFCASDSSGGQGGTGGGGIGATGECVRRPVRGNPPSYGGGPVGGGGGGGAGTIPGGDGGSGTGEVRTPLPLGPDDIIHVCLNKLYVVYGARYFNPKVYYCVPVPDCSAPTSPTSNGSVSSLDPECCPSGPVSPDDPNHCVVAPESAESSPTDGYATLSGDDVLASGLVGSLTEDLEADDRAPALATPAPLHYEHGIPDGYMKVNPEDYPDITPPTCTTDYVQGMGVADSPRDIDCTGGDPGDKMFDYSFLDGGLRIHPAELKVKPKHLRVAYGTSEPNPYEFTIKGFKLGETVEDISTLPTCDSDYTDSASAGSRFDITCSGGVADNYTFKYEKSHIHVDKRRVPLRPVDRTVTYGDPVPEFGFTLSGLFGPESSLAPERLAGFVAPLCSSAYTPVTSAGTVDIDCVGAASTNYEFVPVKGTITVRKASLRVLPKSMTVAYGAASPQVGFELSGFVNGETVPGSGYTAPKCSATGYTATTAAGSSLLVTCTGGSSRNYELDQTAQSTLLVTRATATITADAKTVAYGSAAPGFTYTVAGLRNGETPVSAGVSAANCSSSYTPSTDVGTVPVTCTGASSSNYDFTYVPSTITVTKATLRVTPDAKSVTYGQAMPALSWSVDGFANGQSPLSATGYSAPTCSTSATAVSNAGSYAITCSGGSAANYQFAYGTSQVTVNKAVLKATPANASVVYGSAAPTVGVTVTGFVNGQSSSTAAGFKAPTCTSVGYSMATNAGTYGITCAGGSATNYSFDNSASSVLTVTKATATVTAASKSVVYGTANPGWTFTLSGLKNSQTAATVAGLVAPTCVSTYTVTTAAGSVPAITCSGGSSTNYSFTYVAGKATVTKATLVVTPDAKSILKGSAIPAYTFTVAGYVNGQTASVLTAQPKCTSSYTTRSAVGSYTISCSGATAANYTVTYKTATLTVR